MKLVIPTQPNLPSSSFLRLLLFSFYFLLAFFLTFLNRAFSKRKIPLEIPKKDEGALRLSRSLLNPWRTTTFEPSAQVKRKAINLRLYIQFGNRLINKVPHGFFEASLNLRAERVNLCAEVEWPATSSLGSLGACTPGKFWNLILQKRPFYAFLMLSASRFPSPDITKNRSYSEHLPETLTEDKHFKMTLEWRTF